MTQEARAEDSGSGVEGRSESSMPGDRPIVANRPPLRSTGVSSAAGGFGGGSFGGPGGPRRGPGGPRRGRYVPRRKVCIFCVDHADAIDYKNHGMLRRYLSERAKIEPRRKTGTCAKHQRMLSQALQRARHIALLPFISDTVAETRTRY